MKSRCMTCEGKVEEESTTSSGNVGGNVQGKSRKIRGKLKDKWDTCQELVKEDRVERSRKIRIAIKGLPRNSQATEKETSSTSQGIVKPTPGKVEEDTSSPQGQSRNCRGLVMEKASRVRRIVLRAVGSPGFGGSRAPEVFQNIIGK